MKISTDQKPTSLPLGELYGDIQSFTRIFYWFTGLIITGLIAGILIVLSAGNTFAAALIAIAILPVLAAVYFIRRQKFERAAMFLAFVLLSLCTLIATYELGIHHISILAYPAILIIASLVMRKRIMALLTLFAIGCAAWLVFGELSGAYTPKVLERSVPGDFFSVAITLIVTAVMVRLLSETLFKSMLQLQRELKERKLVEEEYRNFVEQSAEGIWRLAFDEPISVGLAPEEQVHLIQTRGYIAECNDALARMYGLPSSREMVGKRLLDLYGGQPSHTNFQSTLQLVRADYRSTDRLTEEINEKGERVYFLNNAVGIIKDGTLVGIWGTQRDLTERMRAEEAIRRQAQELALEGDVRTAMAQELDLPALLRNVVESIAKSYGYTLVSLYLLEGETLILQHQVGYEHTIPKIAVTEGVSGRVVRTGKPVLLEDVRSDPEFLGAIENLVSEICIPLFDEGRVVGTLNVESTKDIKLTETDLKLLTGLGEHIGIAIGQARLYNIVQRRNRILSALKKSTLVLMRQLDLDDVLQTIISQAAQIIDTPHGYIYLVEPDEKALRVTLGTGVFSESIGKKLKPDEGLAGKVWRSGQPLNVPDYHAWLGRSLQFDDITFHAVTGVPLTSRSRVVGVLGLAHLEPGRVFTEDDINLLSQFAQLASIALENARLFAEREELIKDLEVKNAELERFTYTVSHDLKSPLITIRGFLNFIEQDTVSGNQERLKVDVNRIGEATEKMQRLLGELLELSRIGRLRNELTDIPFETLAREAVEVVQGRILEKKIIVKIQPDLPVVLGDKPRLLEVLQNLVDNAAKFMGDQPDPFIEIGQQGEEDSRPIFFVRDNGVGIAPEHHERVFGLFNKLDANSDGTGVGLAVVKRIIEVHGGRIWVESEPGKGSTFYFTLVRGG